MIRRKLTRIEVTLDDTKELDELFIKPFPTTTATTASTGIVTKPGLELIAATASAQAIDSTTSGGVTANSSESINNKSATASFNNTSELQELSSYNPSPYIPTTRFN